MEANDYSATARYWGSISRNLDELICPSPVNIPAWAEETARWLAEGNAILEVGPGRADLAAQVLSGTTGVRQYYLADVSEEILAYAATKLAPLAGATTVTTIHADLNQQDALRAIPAGTLDRIILLNVFGYLNPATALPAFSSRLKPGAFLRFTIQDFGFFSSSANYDAASNCQLVTKRRKQADDRAQPQGHAIAADGTSIPVYGYRRGYSADHITRLLQEHDFTDVHIRTVVLPKELLTSLQGRGSFTPAQEMILAEYGGRPIWDIVARKGE